MKNRLLTKGAKYGDILWAMVAARKWFHDCGEPIDFACMTLCAPILELIRQQPYIRQAYYLDHWKEGCSPTSSGPNPLEPLTYDEIRHGSYHKFPDQQLARFIAQNIGFTLVDGDFSPWLRVPDGALSDAGCVAYAWNHLHPERKQQFTRELAQALPDVRFVDVTLRPWILAARTIQQAKCFLGCRSCNFVIANAVGQKHIITFEPEEGRLNPIFGCPTGPEQNVSVWQQAYEIIKAL